MTKVIRKKAKNGNDIIVALDTPIRTGKSFFTDQKDIASILNGKHRDNIVNHWQKD